MIFFFTPAVQPPGRGRPIGGEAFFVRTSLHHEIFQEFKFGLLFSLNLNEMFIFVSSNKQEYQEQLSEISGYIALTNAPNDFIILGDLNFIPKRILMSKIKGGH